MKWFIRRIVKKGKGSVQYEEEIHFGETLTIGRAANQAIFINDLRAALARKHKADFACPITTGIFSWIAAHAAAEDAAAGRKRFTPWWRTLKTGGELNPKFPGGIAAQKARLEAEGHSVVRKGKRFFVREFEQALARW